MMALINPPKKITVTALKNLGYRLSGKQIPVGNKPHEYGILELWNEDNKKEVSFCILFSTKSVSAIILPFPFHHYELRDMKNNRHFLREVGVV